MLSRFELNATGSTGASTSLCDCTSRTRLDRVIPQCEAGSLSPYLRGTPRQCEAGSLRCNLPPSEEVAEHARSGAYLPPKYLALMTAKSPSKPTNVRRGCARKHTTLKDIPNCAIPQSTARRTSRTVQFCKAQHAEHPEPCNSSRSESRELSLAHDAQGLSVPASSKTTRDWMAMRQALCS